MMIGSIGRHRRVLNSTKTPYTMMINQMNKSFFFSLKLWKPKPIYYSEKEREKCERKKSHIKILIIKSDISLFRLLLLIDIKQQQQWHAQIIILYSSLSSSIIRNNVIRWDIYWYIDIQTFWCFEHIYKSNYSIQNNEGNK